MRANLYFNKRSWIHNLDCKKLILIAFLARFIFASAYDIYVNITHNFVFLPDEEFYSIRGRYISLLLDGYGEGSFRKDVIPQGQTSQDIFVDVVKKESGLLPRKLDETNVFSYVIGLIYFTFGYFPLGVRIFNIFLSIASTYLIYRVADRRFGMLTANLFLLIALFLPTQIGYSITLSKDFLRMFVISILVWGVYG